MTDQGEARRKMTVPRLQRMKAAHEPIVMVTAYDHGLARLVTVTPAAQRLLLLYLAGIPFA